MAGHHLPDILDQHLDMSSLLQGCQLMLQADIKQQKIIVLKSVRSALVDWLIAWLGDAVRQRVGVRELGYPEYAAETAKFAEGQEVNALLRRLDVLQELRDLFNTNVPEGLAIEVSFLKAFGG